MRKIIIIFLILLIILSLIRGDEKNYILLAGDYKFPPFEYLDEEGNPRGFSVDIVKELSKEINKTIIINLMPWSEAVKVLRERKVDGVELMRITEERKKEFDFIPYIENYSVIVVKRDSNIQNFMDLKGKKISCLNMDVAHNFLLGVGEVIPKISSEEAIKAVLKGEASAGVTNYYSARWIINKNEWQDKLKILPDKLFTNYSGIALPKGSPLFNEIQIGISKIVKSPVYNDLLKKWFGEEIILKQEAKRREFIFQILIFMSALIFLILSGIYISRRYLKKEIYKQTLKIRSLLEENKRKYNELDQAYNFLREIASKDIEKIEEIYFEKLKELFPNCKIKYFKKINNSYLLSKSYPEDVKYTISLESLDKIEGEKHLFKYYDKVLSFIVIQGKDIEKSKEIFGILSEEFENILLNIEIQRKLKQSQEVSNLLDVFSSLSYGEKSVVLEDFLKRIIQNLQADSGSIMSYSEEEGLLRVRVGVGLPKEVLENTVLKIGEGIAGWVAQNKKPLILEDVSKDERFKCIEPKINIKSSICYPLIHQNKVSGVLNINSFKDYRKFDTGDILLIEKMAPLLAAILSKEEVEERIKTLNREALFILVEAIDARDPYTGGHSREVRNLSLKLGREIGLKEEDLKILEYASYLHDVGKIKVPDSILKKPDKLDKNEFNIIKMHTVWGEELVRNFSVFKGIEKIIRHHHERWDGKGYPDGLKEEEAPLFSRIITLADSFQAMTSFRPYRKKLSLEEAIEEIRINKGKQFDPYLSEVFIEIILFKYKK